MLPGVLQATEQALTLDEFAYTATLLTDRDTPYYELDIPEQVYQSAARDDLGDIRVFNGAGQVVPHGFRDTASEKISQRKKQSLAFFPLYKQADETSTDLHLNIQRNASGEIIDIKGNSLKPSPEAQLNGYLVDLREWKQAIDSIKFGLKAPQGASFIQKLNVSVSQDLARWKPSSNGKGSGSTGLPVLSAS